MSFLDEGTFVGRNAVDDAMKDPEFKALKSDEKQKAIAKLKAGGSVTTEKKGKDLDGDGDIDSDDYLAARDRAIKKAQGKEVEEGKLSKTLGGVAVLATLLGLNKATSEKIYKGDPKIKSLTTQYEKAKEDGDKKAMAKFEKEIKNRKTQIDTGKVDESITLNEAFSPEEVLLLNSLLLLGSGLIGAARVGLVPPNPIKIIRRFLQQRKFNQIYKRLKTDPEIIATAKKYPNGGREWVKYINSKLTDEEKKNLNLVFNRGTLRDKLSDMKESTKTIELPADTTFTLDLKHLMKKHLDEGKSQEEVVKLTKALMKKLHDKGEIKVDGTKVTFVKEADIPQDTQLALPEPDAPDFLGDDGVDYEGGMAKSQMLKMKKYAAALCDMIEDESQLEAWVQAKLTKASDYMSAVYHYLDYQQSKMNEGFELNNRKVVDLEGEADGEDSYITAAYYSDTGKPLSDDEIEDLVNKYPADLNPGGAWWEKQR